MKRKLSFFSLINCLSFGLPHSVSRFEFRAKTKPMWSNGMEKCEKKIRQQQMLLVGMEPINSCQRAKTSVKCKIEMSVIILNMTHRTWNKCTLTSRFGQIGISVRLQSRTEQSRAESSRTKVQGQKQVLETDSHRRSDVLNLSCVRCAIFLFRFINHLFMFSLEIIRHISLLNTLLFSHRHVLQSEMIEQKNKI